jgi:hypothetical protein
MPAAIFAFGPIFQLSLARTHVIHHIDIFEVDGELFAGSVDQRNYFSLSLCVVESRIRVPERQSHSADEIPCWLQFSDGWMQCTGRPLAQVRAIYRCVSCVGGDDCMVRSHM